MLYFMEKKRLIVHVVLPPSAFPSVAIYYRLCTASELQVFDWQRVMHITDLYIYVYTDTFCTSSNRLAAVVRTYPKSFRPYYTIYKYALRCVCSMWISRPGRILYEVLSNGFSFEFSQFYFIFFVSAVVVRSYIAVSICILPPRASNHRYA